MKKKVFYSSIATLIGAVMGAGVLGLPYVIANSGYLTGLLLIVFLGLMMMTLNLALGEVVLRTKGNHQLAGYAEIYLGKYGKYFMSLAMIIGIYGALTAYTLAAGQSLFALLNVFSPLTFSLIFIMFAALIIYFGIEIIERFELIFGIIMIAVMALMIYVAVTSSSFTTTNLLSFQFNKILFPFGVILFSFLGAVAIPEMKEELVKQKKSLKKAIIIGSLIPLVIYILFSLSVVGVFGLGTSKIATIGFGAMFGQYMVLLANLFALLAMTTSFVAVGLALTEFYNFDCKLHKIPSFVLTLLIPVIAIFLGISDFIETIGFAGLVAGTTEGIIIVLMFWKARQIGTRKPEYSLGTFKLRGMAIITIFMIALLYNIL